MTTTINYKTLTFIRKAARDKKTFSKAVLVYQPNSIDEHVVNIIKPDITLIEIEQTIFEEKIIRSQKHVNPLYSFVWHLN
jgi:hypothetical protein